MKHNVFRLSYLEKQHWTKGELIKKMAIKPDTVFDYSLPQMWLDKFTKQSGLDYQVILGTTVYAYPKDGIFGIPISGCYEVNKQLEKFIPDRGVETQLVYQSGETIKFESVRGIEREGQIISIWNNPEGHPFAHIKPKPMYLWEEYIDDYSIIICLDSNYLKHSFGTVIE